MVNVFVRQAFLSHDDAEREWESAISAMPESVALWTAFLARRRRAFSTYSVSANRALLGRAIGTFALQLDEWRGCAVHAAGAEAKEGALILMLAHAAWAESSAGYTERAIGIFVALIEYNIFTPGELSGAPIAERASAFEEYWDSEAPRAGSSASEFGWRHWYAQSRGNTVPVVTVHDDVQQAVPAKSSANLDELADTVAHNPLRLMLSMWAHQEACLEDVDGTPILASQLPHEADADPERVVFAEDLKPYLVALYTHEAHVMLFLLSAALLGVSGALKHLPTSHPLSVLVSTAASTPEDLLPIHRSEQASHICVVSNEKSPIHAGGPRVNKARQRKLAQRLLISACSLFPGESRVRALERRARWT